MRIKALRLFVILFTLKANNTMYKLMKKIEQKFSDAEKDANCDKHFASQLVAMCF